MHKSCGEQTNVAHGIDITNPATETVTSAEFSLTNHTEHDSQDMAVDVAPNEAYGVTSSGTQITLCGESVYQTNVAYGITKPAIETVTSAEFSLTHHTEHDSQDMAVDVAPNEAYGVTPAGLSAPLIKDVPPNIKCAAVPSLTPVYMRMMAQNAIHTFIVINNHEPN